MYFIVIGIESGAVSKLEGPRGPEHFLARRALDTTEVLSVNVPIETQSDCKSAPSYVNISRLDRRRSAIILTLVTSIPIWSVHSETLASLHVLQNLINFVI